MKFEVYYTEQFVTTIEAASKEEAHDMFEEGDFETGKYVEGTTEIVGTRRDSFVGGVDA